MVNEIIKNSYKKTEIGNIPIDWEVSSIAKCLIEHRGGASLSPKDFTDEGVKIIPKKGVTSKGILSISKDDLTYTSYEYAEKNSRSMVDKSYLITVLRDLVPSGPSIGRVVKLIDNQQYLLAQGVYGFKVNEALHHDFLIYLSNSYYFRTEMKKKLVGSTQVHLRNSDFFNTIIPLPNIREQQKISAILSSVDRVIKKTEAIIEQTEKVKKGLMQQLLTKGIGHTKFKKSEIGEIPEEWEIIDFGDIADPNDRYSLTGGPFGSDLTSKEYTEDGIQIIQLQNIGDGYFNSEYKIFTSEEKADSLMSCNIYPGDIIMAKMAEPVARACIVPNYADRFIMASDGIRLSADGTKFDTEFVAYSINAPYFRNQAIENSTGTTRLRIGLKKLRTLKFLVPPMGEQKKIAKLLNSVDSKIDIERKNLDQFKKIKKGLMQVLLTGKVRVKVDEEEVTTS